MKTPVDRAKCARRYPNALFMAREAARVLGYALTVHGSMTRDLDVVAVPWTADAADPEALVKAIEYAVEGYTSQRCDVQGLVYPIVKPHGRLCWVIHLGGGPYIDLSVMPRKETK